MISRQAGWSLCLCVRSDGWMESWFEDRLSDCYGFMWELMAWWKVDLKISWMIAFFMCELMAWLKVDLKTVCLISLFLCEKWWLDGKLIWRQSVWFHCLYVNAYGWMESWFEDRLSDFIVFYLRANGLMESWFEDRLDDLLFFVWELMAGWRVDLEIGWLISLSLCES